MHALNKHGQGHPEQKQIMAAASGSQRTLDGRMLNQTKQSRMSYTREYKLEIVKAYQGTTLYQTTKQFFLNTKTIGRWVADVDSPTLVIVLIFNLVLSIL